MALLALSMWSWIGIAALGWVVFSFAFALWVGRLIRVSEQLATAPRLRRDDDYREHEERVSGVQFRTGADTEYAPPNEERAVGSRSY